MPSLTELRLSAFQVDIDSQVYRWYVRLGYKVLYIDTYPDGSRYAAICKQA